MSAAARGRAGGKVILLGEHAVVYGRPALATGLRLGLEVELRRGVGPAVETDPPALAADGRPLRLLADGARLLGLEPSELIMRVRSELPAGVGLGSSAALTVALVRALAAVAGRTLAIHDAIDLGRRLETIFHGHPSGIDPAAAALGSCFRFVRGEPPSITLLRLARPLAVVIAFGDRPRSTGAAVEELRARWEAEPAHHERLFDEVAGVVERGAAAVEAGDLAELGRAFDANQALLQALGVSSPEVEDLVAAAQRAGALGAKLTGGGAGGAIVALASDAERLAGSLRGSGAHVLVARIDGAAEEEARHECG